MSIVFRADSSQIIGSGHIMRCLVLADELKSETIFACRDLPGNIIAVIEARGYKVKILSEAFDQGNEDFLDFVETQKPDILIFDNYDIDIALESKARAHVGSIIVIDDIANRKHDCDLLLDQNPCPATHKRYKNLIPDSAIKLLGLEYALLGKEFSSHRKNISSPQEIKNTLIFFGGGDHKNLTQKTIEALIANTDLHFDVVVGASNPNKDKIRTLCESQPNFSYHCQINNMAELMAAADLFIGAGGSTSWERMCVGLPAITISIADNQVEGCLELAKLDIIKYLGNAEEFTVEELLGSIKWIQENPNWLYNAAISSKKKVDGTGATRVSSWIKSLSITLNPAKNEDCEDIFTWRNFDKNRRYSINTEKIEFENHQKWFTRIINDNNYSLLIAYKNNQPLAVVRFDYANNVAEISLYMVPNQHGKGLGLPLLFAAESWLRKRRSDITEITAKVLEENSASVRIFKYALYNVTKSGKSTLLFNKGLK